MEYERMARGHVTEAHYRRVAAELYERTAGEQLNFHTAGAWLGEWLANTKATVKAGTYEKYRGTVDDFRAFLGKRAGAPLASITPKEILAYRDALQERGLAASTINLAIRKTLGAPFEAARKLGYVTVNPCAAIKPVRDNVAKAKARRQPFTPGQIATLLKTTKGTNWEGAILCGMTTALRLGDIAALTWAQIDLPARVLRLTTTKTETEQSIPLHPAFVAWLGNQTRGIGKAPVFPESPRCRLAEAFGIAAQRQRADRGQAAFAVQVRFKQLADDFAIRQPRHFGNVIQLRPFPARQADDFHA
jgi:integrase